MKYFISTLMVCFFTFKGKGQTIYVADSMESPASWRGVSNSIGISSFVGLLSSTNDNPPSYPMYASYDSCYQIRGNGLGSSTVEYDTLTYPNLPVVPGKTYEIRYKIASFGLGYFSTANTPAGVDAGDTLEFQYRLANSTWFRDARIIGNNNSMWSFDGAIGTNVKLAISRLANTTPNVYVSNPTNPITSMAIRLTPGTYSTIQIRFVTKINATGETYMIDDVQVWDVTPTLPVELISFTGKSNGNCINLEWSTASEINNNHFEILKSNDGITYNMLSTIVGNGTSSQINNYRYDDYDLNNNYYIYKLKQVDFDGNFKEYDPIVVYVNSNNRKRIKLVNLIGQEVNEDYSGFKLIVYE